mmetsp:Transcript_18569/g.22717  ORF Transcript_18569/g.22717 Transcript_18569/m.22717 type:complete len:335 (+) Transcript_18569:200-1204(+)
MEPEEFPSPECYHDLLHLQAPVLQACNEIAISFDDAGETSHLLPAESVALHVRTILQQRSMFIDQQEINHLQYLRNGNFGRIHEVRWRGLKCTVEVSSNSTTMDMQVATEIKTLLSLRHPSVVMFLGAFVDIDNCFILRQEFCCTLEEVIAQLQLQPIDPTTLYREAVHVAQGLAYLHGQSLIHRNITPSNILINSSGHCMIANFSNSCFLAGDYAESFEFVDGIEPKTSYRYMAPELFSKSKYGNKVDVYSYGLILYAILTGSQPFSNTTCPITVARIAMLGERPSRDTIKTQGYCDLLDLLWNQDAEKRPAFTTLLTDNLKVLNPVISCSIM